MPCAKSVRHSPLYTPAHLALTDFRIYNHSLCKLSSAEEALEILRTDHTVSLIISDIVMGGMNGYDFCAMLKQTLEYSHIPVILLTAKQTAEDQVVDYKMGADAYLTKPFDIQVLDAMIANLLQKQQKQTIDYRHQLVFDVKEMNQRYPLAYRLYDAGERSYPPYL